MALAIPAYTFSGTHTASSDNNYWYIYIYSSGTLYFTKATHTVDVFLVGGGGSGNQAYLWADRNAGGGGGYTTTGRNITAAINYPYVATIGAGGAIYAGGGQPAGWQPGNGSNGGTTSMFDISAAGGACGNSVWLENGYDPTVQYGGNGGSAGGSSAAAGVTGINAGSNGGNSGSALGQGVTTTAFAEGVGTAYSGGGGGGGVALGNGVKTEGGLPGVYGGGRGASADGTILPAAGIANSGGGGGSPISGAKIDDNWGWTHVSQPGGSGLIIVRGRTADVIPVVYNNTQLTQLYFSNGGGNVRVTSLYYNNQKLF